MKRITKVREEAILLEDVVKLDGNGRRVINGFSLRIFKGESVGLSGAAGSGKTCLTRLIAGMEPPDSGSITVMGKPIHRMTADAAAKFRNLHIGLVSQYPGFLRRLTVLENVAMPLTLRGVALSTREKAARERLQMLGLLYAAQTRPSQLSLLELQTAAIARALVHRPGILLLDDMEAELSQRDREKIADRLREIRKLEQVTIVALTSSKNSILDTDRMLHLADGKAYIVDHC